MLDPVVGSLDPVDTRIARGSRYLRNTVSGASSVMRQSPPLQARFALIAYTQEKLRYSVVATGRETSAMRTNWKPPRTPGRNATTFPSRAGVEASPGGATTLEA